MTIAQSRAVPSTGSFAVPTRMPRFSTSVPAQLDAWLDALAEQARVLTERFQREPSELVAGGHRLIGGPLDEVQDARGDERVRLTPRGTLLVSTEAADRLTTALDGSSRPDAVELAWLHETSRRILAADVACVGPRTHVRPPEAGDVLASGGLGATDEQLDRGVREAWSADHIDEALRAIGTDRGVPGLVPDRPVRARESVEATAARSFASALAARTGQSGPDELTRLAQGVPGHRFGDAAHRLVVVRGLPSRLSERHLGRAEERLAATLRAGFDQACRLPAGPFAAHRVRAAAARTVSVVGREADRMRRAGVVPRLETASAESASSGRSTRVQRHPHRGSGTPARARTGAGRAWER